MTAKDCNKREQEQKGHRQGQMYNIFLDKEDEELVEEI